MNTGTIGHRICCFGDSLVNGVRDAKKGGWPMRLGQRLLEEGGRDVTIYNLGIRADTSERIKARWQHEASLRMVEEFPTILIFSFGVNDANHAEDRGEETTMRVSPAASAANAAEIIRAASKLAPTLWVGPQAVIDGSKSSQEINQRLEGLNQIYLETARGFDVPYLDLHATTLADDTWQRALRRGDGYHPDTAGYDRLADLIWEWGAVQKVIGL